MENKLEQMDLILYQSGNIITQRKIIPSNLWKQQPGSNSLVAILEGGKA
jgi:hypothetical protein